MRTAAPKNTHPLITASRSTQASVRPPVSAATAIRFRPTGSQSRRIWARRHPGCCRARSRPGRARSRRGCRPRRHLDQRGERPADREPGEQPVAHAGQTSDHGDQEDRQPCHQAELAGGDRLLLHRVQRPAEPGDASRQREHCHPGQQQAAAERSVGRLAVVQRDQPPAEPAAPQRRHPQREQAEGDGRQHHQVLLGAERQAEQPGADGADRALVEQRDPDPEHLERGQVEDPLVERAAKAAVPRAR